MRWGLSWGRPWGGGPQTVAPAGIASAEAFGTPNVGLALAPTGIASAEAFGTPVLSIVTLSVRPTGIASAEGFGSPIVAGPILVTGIASAEAFGNPQVSFKSIAPTGIASEEKFGVPTIIRGQNRSRERGEAIRLFYATIPIACLRAIGTLPGVIIEEVAGRNGPGFGTLRSYGTGMVLAWAAPNSTTYGPQVDVSAGGSFRLEDGADPNKWVRVLVLPEYMGTTPAAAQVLLSDQFNQVGGDDVAAPDALAGFVKNWTLEVKNESGFGLSGLRAWLDSTVSGFQLSSDGISYFNPTSETAGSVIQLGSIAPGSSVSLYVRRTTTAGAAANVALKDIIHMSWTGI